MSERAGFDGGPEGLLQAMARLRARTVDLLAELSAVDWDRPSRCAGWSVHDVARHVRDVALIHTARLAGRPSPFPNEPFDPRSSPEKWLRHSAGATTSQTVEDLQRLAREEAELLGRRVDDPPDRLW